jgi:sugar-specific transcriptional regulator TrmB
VFGIVSDMRRNVAQFGENEIFGFLFAMADNRGKKETDKLKQNVEEQLERLLQQLEDLKQEKDNMEESEYNEMLNDTMEQLKEFQKRLEKMVSGNMTLVDQVGSYQLAIQAAVSKAFKTPEVIKLFAKKQPGQLRQRLTALQRDMKLGKVAQDSYIQQAVEILAALKKLGEPLSNDEIQFLQAHMTQDMHDFEQATSKQNIGQGAKENILNVAASKIQSAQAQKK